MTGGLLDLPAPVFGWIDGLLSIALPPIVRLVFWALLGAAGSMALYVLLSPQGRIAEAKREATDARRRLNAYDGEFSAAGPLIKDQLATSLRRVALVLPATLIASLPLLCLLVWLETAYGYAYPPPDQAPVIITQPESLPTRWVEPGEPGTPPHVQVLSPEGEVIVDIALDEPVTTVHERQWWNLLIGNPAGYLPPSAPVNSVGIALPSKAYLPFGPAWARSWVTVFLLVLVIASLFIHRYWDVE